MVVLVVAMVMTTAMEEDTVMTMDMEEATVAQVEVTAALEDMVLAEGRVATVEAMVMTRAMGMTTAMEEDTVLAEGMVALEAMGLVDMVTEGTDNIPRYVHHHKINTVSCERQRSGKLELIASPSTSSRHPRLPPLPHWAPTSPAPPLLLDSYHAQQHPGAPRAAARAPPLPDRTNKQRFSRERERERCSKSKGVAFFSISSPLNGCGVGMEIEAISDSDLTNP
ncbi:hypothetical protein CRG98_002375 [Punica granatum]|uniref:Uncharacterized protein n=1 Tax=Punica granatum TaxID=22663 RepID=A0A2I0L981_PUNGR|nr:hypothetical protein CRG98_002375 [Punica granatum]